MKKKLNLKKIILWGIIVILVIYVHNKLEGNDNIVSNILPNYSDGYKIIKQDKNKNYPGKGQEKVNNKKGYFTTFTTEDNKTYIEYKQNGNSPWSNNKYWGSTMSENGCGITVMSIILSGYGKNYTPEDLRERYYPVMNYEKFHSELKSTFGIDNSDFYYDSVHLSENSIIEHLQTNKPIIVCVWNDPTDNRWTTASHYMALLAADNDDMVYVSNPNRFRKQ